MKICITWLASKMPGFRVQNMDRVAPTCSSRVKMILNIMIFGEFTTRHMLLEVDKKQLFGWLAGVPTLGRWVLKLHHL